MTRQLAAAADIGPGRVTRVVIIGVVAALFAIPIAAMLGFTLRGGLGGGVTLDHWAQLGEGLMSGARSYRTLSEGLIASLVLALASVVIVVAVLMPTMVLAHLTSKRASRLLELVCIIPITIPAIVLVVGLAPVYRVVSSVVGSDSWSLALAYGIIALPYAHRAIAASMRLVDVTTLSEASRSLGAGWLQTLVLVILPSIRRGVLTASVLTVAIVLGEYTIASLLGRTVLQTSLVQIQQTDAFASVIVSLLALAFAFVLLLVIGGIGGAGRRTRRKP